MLLSVALCFSLLHRVKRRALLAVSLLVVVAAHVEWSDGRPPYPAILIVPFAGFVFFGLIGVLPIPWILSGEIFPTPVSVQNNCSPTPLRFRNEFHETVPVLYDETAQLYSVVLMRVVMQGGSEMPKGTLLFVVKNQKLRVKKRVEYLFVFFFLEISRH